MNHYPIYIITKGRWMYNYTPRALSELGASYFVVVEPQEYMQYKETLPSGATILTLPFSSLGKGSIPARNFVWWHAKYKMKQNWHWILDDNIKCFRYLNENKRSVVANMEIFRACEHFVEGYENIAMAGMQYTMFAVSGSEYYGRTLPPFLLNTRVYSCILLNSNMKQRWRGRYNEDTDLSLRFLKAGWCTVLFYAFLCDKCTTMTMKGGNESLYIGDGRYQMAKSLYDQHPDVVKISQKWGRYQHVVDYSMFRQQLIASPKPREEIAWNIALKNNL